MSFGTDLGDAYTLLSTTSTFNEPTKYGAAMTDNNDENSAPLKKLQPQSTALPQLAAKTQVQQIPQTQHQVIVPVTPTVAAAAAAAAVVTPIQSSPSYIDHLGVKRREMLKVVSYALMILLALAIYTAFEFWLKEFLHNNDFSFKQELGIKCAYPLLIIFIIWNLKAFI
jgi:hypothetical protein